jgi:hypothetical protein
MLFLSFYFTIIILNILCSVDVMVVLIVFKIHIYFLSYFST